LTIEQKVAELRTLTEKYKYERVLPALAQNRIGDLFAAAREYGKAREAYEQTIESFPYAPRHVAAAYLALAAMHVAQEDFRAAADACLELHAWLQLRDCDPDLCRRAGQGYVSAMLLKARAELEAKDVKLALSTYSQLIEFDRGLPEAHRGVVDCLAQLGRNDETILRYRPITEASPLDHVAHFALARAYSYHGPADWVGDKKARRQRADVDRQALELLNRAILVRYDVPYYHQLRGFLYNRIAVAARQDEAKLQALESYVTALALSDPARDPVNHAALLFNVGEGYMLVGQEENAYDYYIAALEAGFSLEGLRGEAALESISRSARAAGEYEAAAEYLQQLLARLPEQLPEGVNERVALLIRRARILDQLALSYYLGGEHAQAARYYGRTMEAIEELAAHHPAARAQYLRNLLRAQRNQAINIYHAADRGALDVRELERAYGLLLKSVERVADVGVVETEQEGGGLLFTIDIEVAAGKTAGAAQFDLKAEKRLLYSYLARISARAGDYEGAAGMIEKKLDLYPKLDVEDDRADVLSERAIVLSELGKYRMQGGDLAGAADAFREAMALDRAAGVLKGEMSSCYSLGKVALRLAALPPAKRGMSQGAFTQLVKETIRSHRELVARSKQEAAAHLAQDSAGLSANLAQLLPLLPAGADDE